MHCCAALDTATSGSVYVGDTELNRLKDKELTRLRRDEIGFVFQSFNLVPTLTAEENVTLPLSIAGRRPDPDWYRTVIDAVGLRTGSSTAQRAVRRPAAAGRRRPGTGQPAVDRVRRRAHGQPRLPLRRGGARPAAPVGRRVRADGRDGHPRPDRAAYTDRVLFLADGKVVDELRSPDRETVLQVMARMDAPQPVPPGGERAPG